MKNKIHVIILSSLLFVFANNVIADEPASQAEKLIFSIDLIRHGDRTPIADIPKSPHTWPGGLGELTATGVQQEEQLGASLRHYYIDEMHLLPEKYDPDTLAVRSTDLNRTIMSAQAFLNGLYPIATRASKNEKIAIDAVAKSKDTLLVAKPSMNPLLLINLYFENVWYWDQQTAPLKNQLIKWRADTGMPLNDFRSLDHLADHLYIRYLHHIPMPEGMSDDEAKQIMLLAEAQMVQEFKFKELSKPMGREFLKFVSNQLQSASTKPSKLKYILLSGHDSSIMAVMSTLSVPMEHIPDYASHLNFSLFAADDHMIVSVSFNGKPVNIPACGGNRCTLEQFAGLDMR